MRKTTSRGTSVEGPHNPPKEHKRSSRGLHPETITQGRYTDPGWNVSIFFQAARVSCAHLCKTGYQTRKPPNHSTEPPLQHTHKHTHTYTRANTACKHHKNSYDHRAHTFCTRDRSTGDNCNNDFGGLQLRDRTTRQLNTNVPAGVCIPRTPPKAGTQTPAGTFRFLNA